MRGVSFALACKRASIAAGLLASLQASPACNDDRAQTDTSGASETRDSGADETTSSETTPTETSEPGEVAPDSASDGTDVTDSDDATDADGTDGNGDEGEVANETSADSDPGETDVSYEHDPAKLVLHGACPLATRVGGFEVVMNLDVGYSAVDGTVKNAVTPSGVPTEAASEGGCRLLQKQRLFCDPPCDPSSTCGFGGTCVPAPLGQDMGALTFRGLVKLVQISATQPGNTYFYTHLSNPGFAPGEVVQLTSTPGYMGALELYGVGVSPVTAAKLVLTQGSPATVTWDAPTTNMRSQIHLEVNIDQHGVTPASLACDFEDTGSGIIPAAIVDGLIALGVTGFPSGSVARHTVDSIVVADQCADFAVTAVRQLGIEVTNFIPCTSTENCPDGKTCNLNIQQCQ